jgi:hypothetical protein
MPVNPGYYPGYCHKENGIALVDMKDSVTEICPGFQRLYLSATGGMPHEIERVNRESRGLPLTTPPENPVVYACPVKA